jgi:enoyl-CoA hydratase/carnithine racemase
VTFEDLYQHPFFKTVTQDSIDAQTALGLGFLDELDDSTTIDELQFYVMRVGFSLSHALSWVEQLHQAVHFMTDFGYGKKANDLGIKRPAHLLYNIENYLIRLQSVYDRCLQLTNVVFHICISDELVGHSLIVSNLHVSRTPVPKLLKAVKKAINDYAQDRHKLIHRHSHMDSDLRKIELLYMHSKETWSDDANFTYERLVIHRAERVRAFTTQRKADFVKINEALVLTLGPLFDELLIQYNRQKSRLEKLV